MVALPDINSIMGTTDIEETSRQDSVNTDWTASETDCLGSIRPRRGRCTQAAGSPILAYQVLSPTTAPMTSAPTWSSRRRRLRLTVTHGVLRGVDESVEGMRRSHRADRHPDRDPDTGQRIGPLTRTDISLEQVSTPTDRRQWALPARPAVGGVNDRRSESVRAGDRRSGRAVDRDHGGQREGLTDIDGRLRQIRCGGSALLAAPSEQLLSNVAEIGFCAGGDQDDDVEPFILRRGDPLDR